MLVRSTVTTVAGTLLTDVNPLERYMKKLLRTDSRQPAFQCPVCGCTYGPDSTTCEECWNDRLVRVE